MRPFLERVARVNRRVLERVGQVLARLEDGREVLGLFEEPNNRQQLERPEKSAPGLHMVLSSPCFVGSTADLQGVATGAFVELPTGRYRVEDVLPDGGGMTRLDLVPAQSGGPAPGKPWR